jgi:HlyD family secretion protein
VSAPQSPNITKLARRSARTHVLVGSAVVFLVLGGVSVWAARTEISGAVLSPGVIVVESEVKKVQHPTGGVVSDIRVSNGSRVSAGDILIRLDETVSRASLQMITKQLDELAMREARLEAERDGASTITIPQSYAGRETEPEIIRRIAGETAFFTSRRATMNGQKKQLSERIHQYEQEIKGLERQAAAKAATGDAAAAAAAAERVVQAREQALAAMQAARCRFVISILTLPVDRHHSGSA